MAEELADIKLKYAEALAELEVLRADSGVDDHKQAIMEP
jgi:hypothetical protein